MNPRAWSIGQWVTTACTLEVSIPKPGNVHRSADFSDTCFQDFLLSAIAIGPVFDATPSLALGSAVLRAVESTLQVVNRNTNLGMILLLAPLAAVAKAADGELTSQSILQYLENTTAEDCREIYQAIALCQPGGLGKVSKFDVQNAEPPEHILAAMRQAESRDMIARQYVNGFSEVLNFVWPEIRTHLMNGKSLVEAVIQAHLRSMHEYPDSLIARKNGEALAAKSAAMAGHVLSSGAVGEPAWLKALADFDFWLRADGNRRNPGTTADLIAAAIFVGLVNDEIDLKRAWR
ncbi:MAG: triphosphoribosyl-dephospho-CoA synthase [Pirellulaceae bacterium]|nr:triphosphoribosyl-dephospho-CoA synthase [Pirellulaceae bacterium]